MPQPAASQDPRLCHRLLDSQGQVQVSLFWGHCSFLLGPSVHRVLFVPSKSLFPQSCVSAGGSMVGLMVTSSKRAYAIPRSAAPRALGPAAGNCQPMPPQETPGHSRATLGQSLAGSLLPSPGSWCAQGSVCALQYSVSPVLCKFWQLYGRVNGDLLQEGLCHPQVCCTQSPCPCGSPLLTHMTTGDAKTQFCFSLCGVSGS